MSNKRLVSYYCVRIGDGTVILVIPIVNNRPITTEAYTLPAKKAIDERIDTTILRAGYFLNVRTVATREPNETNNEPLRNSRQYLMKVFAAQSDNVMMLNERREKVQILTEVSTGVCSTYWHKS